MHNGPQNPILTIKAAILFWSLRAPALAPKAEILGESLGAPQPTPKGGARVAERLQSCGF